MSLQIGPRIRRAREERGWSQAELAARTGLSRTAVSAVEGDRSTPAVSAALALARAFGTTVESLFGQAGATPSGWAWHSPVSPTPYWHIALGDGVLRVPCEPTHAGIIPPDGVSMDGADEPPDGAPGPPSLLLAGCDPAAALLARDLGERHGIRVVPLMRSSRDAADLLAAGLVHGAGIHGELDWSGPAVDVAHQAQWQVGVAHTKGARSSLGALARPRTRWIARESGASVEQVRTSFLEAEGHTASEPVLRATGHQMVADVLAAGLGDAGVCIRHAAETRRLAFVPLKTESFDWWFPETLREDPALRALVETVRSRAYRQALGALAGYDVSHTGDLSRKAAS